MPGSTKTREFELIEHRRTGKRASRPFEEVLRKIYGRQPTTILQAMKNLALVLNVIVSATIFCGCSTMINPHDPTGKPGAVSAPSRTSCLTVPVTIKLKDVATIVNQIAPRDFQDTW